MGDSLAQDTTELYIYYCKHGSTVKYDDINDDKTIEGKLRTIVMPALEQGSYYIGVELYGERQGNNNYEILSGVKTHEFSVLGNDITFTEEDLNWICNNNPVTDTAFTYTGNPFRFAIDDSNLAAKGVKVDTTKGTNGYSGDITATNAKTGTYSVIVYITSYDSSFNAFDAQYTLTYTIDKAKYDLSGLTWNYDDNNPLQFIAGKTQGITLSGSLPTGLTVTYSGNDKIPVGDYTTTASFNISDAANYVRPVSTDPNSYTGDFVWSKPWKIVPAVLDVAGLWKIDEREDAATYNLPLLQGIGSLDIDSMVTYKYYDYTGSVKGDEINIGDIDMNEEHRFLAVAELKPEYTSNYVLQGGSYDFTVGKDRYPVIVKMDLDGQTLPYKPEGYTPKVSVNSIGGLTVSNITLTYYNDGSTVGSTDTPVAVGKYVVRATLNYGSDDNFIEEGSEFTFEIVKADIDVTALVWQYTHGDVTAVYDFTQGKWVDAAGAEVSPFIYDGSAHTLTLIGADSLSAVTVTTSGNLSETGAGDSYAAKVAFSYDADCYNAPDFAAELNWKIGKATVNTDNMVWGYIVGTDTAGEYPYTGPLVYTRVNGAAIEYSVMLINVPDALKECITVLNNGSDSVSIKGEAGSFRAKFTIDDSKFDSAN
ncbi:MAG: hypothetical protein K2I79_00560, partial [Clostridia bacterium]|nr:hypothetical protein [Clostridia bacterium]